MKASIINRLKEWLSYGPRFFAIWCARYLLAGLIAVGLCGKLATNENEIVQMFAALMFVVGFSSSVVAFLLLWIAAISLATDAKAKTRVN